MPSRYLITGATGFVGGHLAEACLGRGHPVTTLARAGSDTALLDRLGVAVHRGDISDPQVVQKVLEGVDVVVHCAAKVGDRGPVEEFRTVNVEGLRNLLEACKGRPLSRFVHMSTLGVYAARHHYGTDEREPLPANHIDGYTQTKVESEHLALAFQLEHRVPVVVLRPGFVYGPRDKTVLPKLMKNLENGKFHYLGADRRALNSIYIGNLVDAVFLAVDRPQAVAQVYNLTDGETVSKRRFIDAVCDGVGIPHPKQNVPRWLAGFSRWILRQQMRIAGPKGKAWLTPAKYKFVLLNLDFSIDKARRELGYAPRFTFDQGMKETMAWYRQKV
jgi:nucleoside-diphosphate-sugar epimerase